MIAVLGSGFGLYGYLPALIGGCGQRIVLPERYRAKLQARPELTRFESEMTWSRDDSSAVARASGAAFVKRPADQPALVRDCLALPAIDCLLVEKPLARDAEASLRLFEGLVRSRRRFRIGYTFGYTDWGLRLAEVLAGFKARRLAIEWRFLAYHFSRDLRSWKRFHRDGGGAIRFYGIQFLALLAELGYRQATRSATSGANPEEPDAWRASFAGPHLPECDVLLESRSSRASFRVEVESEMGETAEIAAQSDPFDGEGQRTDGLDRRVGILTRICRDLLSGTDSPYAWYGATLDLWSEVEEMNEFSLALPTGQGH